MNTILNIIIAVSALLLVGVVLIQKSRGVGFAGQFETLEKIFGVQTSAKFLEKSTFILAGIILVASIVGTYMAQ